MLRHFTCLACILLLAVVQPAAASPREDADIIAETLVKSAEYRKMLRDAITKGRVDETRYILSEHSVRARDFDRLEELVSDYEIRADALDLHQRIVADRLIETKTPGQLSALAEYVRNYDPVRQAQKQGNPDRVMTLDEFGQQMEKLKGLADDPTFRREIEMLGIGMMLIGLTVQARIHGKNGPTPPEIADLLEVDGVFDFPNRIARRNVIRELRASAP